MLRPKSRMAIAEMIIGDYKKRGYDPFLYRSSSQITQFFRDCDTGYEHDGSTRRYWVDSVLEEILSEPRSNPALPPDTFCAVIRELMDKEDAPDWDEERGMALSILNAVLKRNNLEAYYIENDECCLRHLDSQEPIAPSINRHRVFTAAEQKRRETLSEYLDHCTEDDLTENILVPLFRALGFSRVSPAGHHDKAQEFGCDLWFRFIIPTGHWIYFGAQIKKGKLDAAGKSKNTNVSEILNQVRMMLDYPIFDPDDNKKHLVDHAIVIAGGEITKQGRQWIVRHLDVSQRSQILFMERTDILDLCVVRNIDPPRAPEETPQLYDLDDECPF